MNNDGVINYTDLSLLKRLFGLPNEEADFDGDGVVDQDDVDILKSRFGYTVDGIEVSK